MRRVVGLSLSLLTLISLSAAPIEAGSSKSLAIISGIVADNKGNPLPGALVSLAREGAPKHTVKHTSTDKYGKFIAKVTPGRYGIKAIAIGFSEVAFTAVDVRAQQELVYKFNLEPVGYGNTLPERRRDREDVKWTLRNSQTRRSIFQAQEGEDATIKAITDAETAATESAPEIRSEYASTSNSRNRTHGVVENYFASNAFTSYVGLNFAISTPISDQVELIFAGQTGTEDAPERLEASTRFRVGDRHKVGVTAAGVRYEAPVWTSRGNEHGDLAGQVSLRAVDEWIVRDGIVIVMGLDYSRFIGAGGAQSFT
ncbi:MAG TPA: carboxypeptidase-like regulatory domain-containing protein, partial [Pyrinomonadaceae bacterium]|nr:carboxypeptidase-like regulatory domain-containing protein [Pyrinomonadaceae bacterium]